MYAGNTRSEILKHSPSGRRAQRLIDGDTVVWDSLAICEYVAEQVPALWPADRARRAEARAVMPRCIRASWPCARAFRWTFAPLPDHPRDAEIEADVARIVAIWEGCRRLPPTVPSFSGLSRSPMRCTRRSSGASIPTASPCRRPRQPGRRAPARPAGDAGTARCSAGRTRARRLAERACGFTPWAAPCATPCSGCRCRTATTWSSAPRPSRNKKRK